MDFPSLNGSITNAHFGSAAWTMLFSLIILVVLNMATPAFLDTITFGHFDWIAAGLVFLTIVFIALDRKAFTSAIKMG